MSIEIPALSPQARRSVLIGTAAITLASATASELVTLLASIAFNLNADVPAYVMAGVIPLLLAGFGSYWQLVRLEQLRAAYRELERVNTTDWLTGCLNRHAFIAAASHATGIGRPGALLVIDADGLKSINSRFGHDRGDDLLRNIVSVVRERVDSVDLVGRIGGEEFGVYLQIATEHQAAAIAEAIRDGVANISFAPAEAALSVSIGIATTNAPIAFSELLRIADSEVQAAKENGRNRIAITAAGAVGDKREAA